jgi:hypothetical protein
MDGTGIRLSQTPEGWARERRKHAAKGQRKQLSLSMAAKAFPAGPLPGNQERMIAEILRMAEGGYSWPDLGCLNPMWVEWLMGFPPGWTDLGASGTA